MAAMLEGTFHRHYSISTTVTLLWHDVMYRALKSEHRWGMQIVGVLLSMHVQL